MFVSASPGEKTDDALAFEVKTKDNILQEETAENKHRFEDLFTLKKEMGRRIFFSS